VTRERWVLVALAGLAVVACVLFAVPGAWVVDDAAIAWSFSRNWAQGHGLVAWAGGERVEGYSDFLWVALVAVGEALGVESWYTAKALGAAFTVATLPLLYRIAGALAPRTPVVAGLAAAAVFAVDTQVSVFGASGLENALFTFLLAAGIWGTLEEARTQRAPWSSLAFLGIALTRPEGIVYAALAGGAALLWTERDRRGAGRIAGWLALFWVPFLAYHAVRYTYFAWPFPMTYYAKVHRPTRLMLDGHSPGWVYLYRYLVELGRGWVVPLLVVGRLGLDHRMWPWLGGVLVVGFAAAYGPLPPPVLAGVWLVLGSGLAVPGLHHRGPAGAAGFVWALGLVSALFAVYAQGDWMGQFRWLSFAAAPFAALTGAGLGHVVDRLRSPALSAVVVGGVLSAWLVVNVRSTLVFSENPDFNPFGVRMRVANARGQWRVLHSDARPRLLTVDMGGFMYWSGMELADWVGLVDVTHGIQARTHRRLLREDWLAEQLRPDFVFVMPEEIVAMRRREVIGERYVQLTYEELLRRDLLLTPTWSGPGPVLDLGPVTLHGLHAPGGPVADVVYVELGLSTPTAEPFTARLLLADAEGVTRASWPVPLGAGLVPPTVWRADEVYTGRFHFDLPNDLEPGTWSLGLRVSLDGAPLVPAMVPEGVRVDGTGGLWPGATFTVATPTEVDAAVEAALATLPADCAEAERTWFLAHRRALDPTPVDERHGARVRAALATCWASRTDGDPADRVLRARRWDAEAPGVAAAAQEVADALQSRCDAHAAAREWAPCAEVCDAVLRADPTRAWTRRTAETCRDAKYRAIERSWKAKAEGSRPTGPAPGE
jgi:hypothetical protein